MHSKNEGDAMMGVAFEMERPPSLTLRAFS
jgi:hypothetical protein